jgi:hypothetical protein
VNRIKFDRLQLGAQVMITDAMIENMGIDGNTKVTFERNSMMRAYCMTVIESFLAKKLKHIERRYIDIPKEHWLYKLIPKKYKKKFIIDVTQIIPIPTGGINHAVIFDTRDTFTRK